MGNLRYVLVVSVTLIGCSPNAMHEALRAQAVSAVETHMTEEERKSLSLKAEANPWGLGLVIYNANAQGPDEVRVWLSAGSRAFALDDASLRATPGLSLIDAADENQKSQLGLEGVSADEVRSRVFRAIREGTYLPETRQP